MDKKEMWFLGILVCLGGAGFIYSLSLPPMGPVALCPGLFPGLVTILMTVLGGVRLIHLLRSAKTTAGPENKEDSDGGERNILIIIGLFLIYLLFLIYIHFIASTIIFLCVAMIFLYRKFYWKIPLIAVITAVGVYYLFRHLLNVRLP